MGNEKKAVPGWYSRLVAIVNKIRTDYAGFVRETKTELALLKAEIKTVRAEGERMIAEIDEELQERQDQIAVLKERMDRIGERMRAVEKTKH